MLALNGGFILTMFISLKNGVSSPQSNLIQRFNRLCYLYVNLTFNGFHFF